MKKNYLAILAFWSILLLSFQANATHFLASDITYTCVNNATNTYEVKLSFYRDCSGINLPQTIAVTATSSTGCTNQTITLAAQGGPIEVSQVCTSVLSTCRGGTAPGVERHDYVGTVVLAPNCGNWSLSYSSCCRSNNITNLTNPGSQGHAVTVDIDNSLNSCNNSVQFTNSPVLYTCAGTPTSYNHGAFDIDGDSLQFSLVAAQQGVGSPVNYGPAFSAINPLLSSTGFIIDPNTGTLTFTPVASQSQSAVVAVQVDEIRNGVIISSTIREMQVIVNPTCGNNPVVLDSVLVNNNGNFQPTNNNVFDACPGQAINFKLYLSDLDSNQTISFDSISSSLLQVFPNANLTITYPNSPLENQLVVEVLIPQTQNQSFSLSFSDNACPIPSVQTYGFLSSSANTTCASVCGQVAIDANNNCTVDSNEVSYRDIYVVAQKGSFTTFVIPDGFGNYVLPLDTGNYDISILTMHPYWGTCLGTTTVNLPSYTDKDTLDVPVNAIVGCPLMEVNIGAPRLISCRQNYYSVNYCNTGTDTAFASYIEVTLDSLFTIDSTTLPIASQSGFTYTFNVGDVAVNECGSFRIYATLDSLCDTTNFGDTYCALARIYPDSFCLTSPQWSGADLMVEAQCNTDSVSFRIQNKGVAPMPSTQTLWVIEDNIIFHSQPFNLGAGAATSWFSYYADGSTYRMQTEQVPNHPWQAQVSAVVEGCLASNSAGTTSTGFVNIFSMNDDAPWESIDCQVALNSWDPNDKTGFPLGYGAQHYIEDDTKLRYRVRFQNTGTAPALDVVILDTLSPHLDVFSVKMGAASHPYTWTIVGDNVLQFTFSNINLPDSASNEPASHGFVDYKIEQQANNPIGTVINNSAAIYFDLNPPVITNTTFHTIGDNFVQVVITSQDDILAENAAPKVRIFPNPFGNVATFEILDNTNNYQEINLMIYDITGQQVRSIQANNQQQILLERGKLSQGVYLFRIEGDNQLLETGKLIVK